MLFDTSNYSLNLMGFSRPRNVSCLGKQRTLIVDSMNEVTDRLSFLAARLEACQISSTRRELLREMRIVIAKAEALTKAQGDLAEDR